MGKILIIDDEVSILETLEMFLSEKGHQVYKATAGEKGLELFYRYEPDIVILDIRLPDTNGIDLLPKIQEAGCLSKVIMITAFQDMETTIRAMKLGAYDYIHKPLDADEIDKAVNRALQVLTVDREISLSDNPIEPSNPEIIIGKSNEMRRIFKMIGLLCQNRATVLIQGETGTGKELIARVIHRNSMFSNEPFVTFDCSAVVESLIESELFGHEKGAFTGATHSRKGKIELAGSGTLFLDEVGELPLSLQGKFLGFLQRREYMRVGGQEVRKSHCRVIAATNRDLHALTLQGRFRQDLFFRLRVVTIHVPALRERLSDIECLVNYFMQKINRELGTNVTKLQNGVLNLLMEHPWKGNVRELENVLVEAIVRARGNVILLDDIKEIISMSREIPTSGLSTYSLPHMEKECIIKTLEETRWIRKKAAQKLGISLPTLRSKIRKYQIIPPDK